MVDESTDESTEESFAELFAQSETEKRRRVSPGEKVSGKVVQVGAERALIDLGGGLDGMIDLGELTPKGEKPSVKVGDIVEAYVLKIENRVASLGKTVGKGLGAKRALEDASRTGIPLEGVVLEVNKGGYVVEIAGARCFCPLGQMDTRRIEDPATMIGKRLQFKVTELRDERDVVLSRRALLEAEQADKQKETRARLAVGAKFTGHIVSVRDFGAFVDIGGLDGLIPASELGYGRVRTSDAVYVGQEVEVEVLRIEPPGEKDRTERITLSMRALAVDPFAQAVADLPEGTIVKGTVVRVQPFGAFVEIVPGVDGLLHVSAFGKRVASPSDVVAVGDEIAVRIDAIDASQRRISLAYIDPETAAALAGELAPEVAPAPAPAATFASIAPALAAPRQTGKAADGPGLKVIRKGPGPAPAPAPVTPVAAAPAPSTARAGKPRVLGHQAPVAPTAESLAAPAPERRMVAAGNAPLVGSVVDVTVDRIETFGLFVSWAGGRGLVPHAEINVPKGADLRKSHPVGTTFKAAIVDVRTDGKVRLSATAAVQAEERAEAANWQASQARPSGKGFGTFADLLSKMKK